MRLRSRATALMVTKSKLTLGEDLSFYQLATTPYGEVNNLCEGERFFEQPTADAGFCSAFLVDADTMVTAGHCISDYDCDRVAFVFDFAFEDPDANLTQVRPENVYECAQVIGRERAYAGTDYAVVRLKQPVLNRKPLVLAHDDSLAQGDALTVIGYPMALPVKISGGAAVRDNSDADFFVANLDTFAGNSGSAVLNSITGEVEGILVRGEGDFETAHQGVDDEVCYLENRCADDACRGEDVTRTSKFRHIVLGTTPPELPAPVEITPSRR